MNRFKEFMVEKKLPSEYAKAGEVHYMDMRGYKKGEYVDFFAPKTGEKLYGQFLGSDGVHAKFKKDGKTYKLKVVKEDVDIQEASANVKKQSSKIDKELKKLGEVRESLSNIFSDLLEAGEKSAATQLDDAIDLITKASTKIKKAKVS